MSTIQSQPVIILETPFSEIVISVIYPEENPEGALDDITDALAYTGVFDSIKPPGDSVVQ